MSSPKDKLKKKNGRPTRYTKALSDEILGRLSAGESLNAICREPDMPAKQSIYRWIAKDYDGFRNRYAEAFNTRAVLMAYELLDIADDGTNDYMEVLSEDGEVSGYKVNGEAINRSRLRTDTRKWLLSKMIPKSFGDKVDKTSEGEGSRSVNINIVSDRGDND
jgi:hypothetical protein